MIDDPAKMKQLGAAHSSYRPNIHKDGTSGHPSERSTSKNQDGRAKLVFKKRERNERSLEAESQSHSDISNLKKGGNKRVDQYFPLDIAFKSTKVNNLLFRLDIQEYQVEE